jgi:hypothetical protein
MRPSLESAVHGSRGLGHGAHSPPTREAGTLNCMSSMLPAWENPPRHHSMARLRACDFTPHAPKSSTRDWVGGHARPAPRVQSLTKTDKRRHGPRPPLSAELRSDTTIGSGRAWGGRQNRKGGCFPTTGTLPLLVPSHLIPRLLCCRPPAIEPPSAAFLLIYPLRH